MAFPIAIECSFSITNSRLQIFIIENTSSTQQAKRIDFFSPNAVGNVFIKLLRSIAMSLTSKGMVIAKINRNRVRQLKAVFIEKML